MGRYCNFMISVLVFVWTAFSASAQYKSVYNLNVTDGLSQNTISAIYQDERDYIWFGTRNGINLYNGRDFTVFKNDKQNPGSIPNNEVKEINGDGKGHLFVRTGNAQILKHELGSDSFQVLVSSAATSMYYFDGLYFAESHEVYFLPDGADSPELLYSFADRKNIITSFLKVGTRLYIGTSKNGLYCLDDTGALQNLVENEYVTSLFLDSEGDVWATFGDATGILRLGRDGSMRYMFPGTNSGDMDSNRTQACCEDHDGNIWVGTFNGLYMFDRKTEKFVKYDNPALANNSIINLMVDHQGTIWAGTYYLGVYYFNVHDQVYSVYRYSAGNGNGPSSDVIGEMLEGRDGSIWIASERGGLNCYDRETGNFCHYTVADGLSSNNVKAMYLDEKAGVMWLGTHLGGLSRFDLKTGRFRNFTHIKEDASSLPSDVVRDVIPYGKDLLLAVKGGIVCFDKVSGKCRKLLSNPEYQRLTNYCSRLLIDSRNNLWMLHTSNGVFRYNLNSGRFYIYQNHRDIPGGVSPGRISDMYEDSFGRLWFCNSQNGLDLFDYETESFVNYDMRTSRFSSNAMYAIAELGPDKYIVTEDNGYSVFYYNENRAVNFQNNINVPLVSANEGSILVASDGEIYIGGMNGLISFNERNMSAYRRQYSIKPYAIRVDGKQVRQDGRTGRLDKDLRGRDRLTIGPGVITLDIELAVTDYLPYDTDELVYRLNGFSDKWQKLDNSRVIAFTNLSPGEYRLEVKSAVGQSQGNVSYSMMLEVRPPFYKTFWAYMVYIFCFSGLLYVVITMYNNKIRLQEAVKYEKMHTREVEELNQYKLRFFTNISHEFRSPLTVIIGQIEMMMDKYHSDMSIYSPLHRMYRSCVQLKDLVSELLDFRKQEQGYMKLKVCSADMVEFVHDQYLNFQAYARQKNITYKFVKIYDTIPVCFDPKQMQKVVNNLIFNAFKHVSANGKITVIINRDNSSVMIDIVNTGKGIRPEEIDKIFNRFYQIDTKDSVGAGTGIGLALSKGIVELHKGSIKVFSELDKETTFRIELPLGSEHFGKEDFLGEDEAREMCLESMEDATVVLADDLAGGISGNTGRESGRTVLVVEDNRPLRETLAQLFSPFYKVILADNGAEGLEMAGQNPVDLIVSDVMMPVMDGIELCRIVKTTDGLSHIPVVLLTAKTEETQKMEGLKYGADDYIFKPFNSRELIARCNNIVNNRHLLRNKFSSMDVVRQDAVVVNNTKDLEFIENAQNIMKQHLSDSEFKLESLARELGVSRTKLFTKLKDIQGVTPMEFMMNIRLEVAVQLLQHEKNLNISEISEKTGFSSPKFFRKCFKDKYGKTPMEFRKS